jgi:uncharacterized protein
MSVETAERAIDFFIRRTKDRDRITVSFYGGEPLLNIDLVKHCVDYIETRYYGKRIDYGLTTNGTLLDDDSISFLADKGFHLMISLDGPKEIHDNRRRFASTDEGSFTVIMENAARIKKQYPDYYQANVSFIAVSDTIQTFSCVNEFVSDKDLFDEGGKFMLSYVSDTYTDNKNEMSDDFFADREYEYFKILLSKLGEYPQDKTSHLLKSQFNAIYMHCFKNIEMEQEHIPRVFHHSGPCIPGVTRLFVDTSGRFFPCERVSELSETVLLGDIENGISLTKALKVLNLEATTHSRCKDCWAYRQCTICVARADDMHGVSAAEAYKACPSVCRAMDNTFKDYCVLRELGYTFDEERLQRANDV